jgi:hypothetical protein
MVDSTQWAISDGRYVVETTVPGGFTAQLYDSGGNAIGPAFSEVQDHLGYYLPGPATALTTGGYALLYGFVGALLPGELLDVASFTAGGQLQATSPLSAPANLSGDLVVGGSAALYALPDGGFLAAWVEGQPFNSTGEAVIREYDASGNPVGPAQDLGPVVIGTPNVQIGADGHYVVSWNSPAGTQQQTFADAGDPAFVPVQTTTLSASAGWTSAAVLSNHALAVVGAQDGGYGSHVGAEQTYDATGTEIASAALMGYAGVGKTLTPEVTALAYGYYQVNYAGSSDYEVYNGADQRVLAHNAYTTQTAAVTPLAGGGYVETDPNANVFAVFDAGNHAVAWDSYAPGSPGAPTVHALPDGGFAFTYAGSREIETYDASGNLLHATSWGDSVQNYAMGFAALGQSGFLGAWIGADVTPGPNAGQTAILIEPFFNDGGTITRTITLAQDLDPWHTQFSLQSHADGSVAILWSQGGGVFGAEYGSGGLSAVHAAVAGDLSSMVVTQLPGDTVGLAWLQNGDVWAEIFDPASGAVQRTDLGASSSADLSTVHALATAGGGLAVSWHAGSAVEAAVLDSAGGVSSPINLPGDLLGVDSLGHAVTVHDQGGTPVLQTYALSGGGLFWAA